MRLFEPSADALGRYMCLSYCWGGASFVRTTTANLHEHLHGIELNTLPQVFRDFIVVARWFQVQFVWIDAFCIIQDSDKD